MAHGSSQTQAIRGHWRSDISGISLSPLPPGYRFIFGANWEPRPVPKHRLHTQVAAPYHRLGCRSSSLAPQISPALKRAGTNLLVHA